jgi:hypothetical protein
VGNLSNFLDHPDRFTDSPTRFFLDLILTFAQTYYYDFAEIDIAAIVSLPVAVVGAAARCAAHCP